MADFVDRDLELTGLEERWRAPSPQVALLWGRRRVGKSTLLRRFAAGKDAVFFQADQGTTAEQLRRFTERLLGRSPDPVLAASPLASWDQALAYLGRLALEARRDGRHLLVVLDEYPYLTASDPALSSRLQVFLDDAKADDLPIFLVLSGSQISMFEEHVLQGPLYGRRTWGRQLAPLGYRDAAAFFPHWSSVDRLRAWAILGGIPYYLEQFEPRRSLAWNVVNRVLRKGQVLFDEAELLVKEELREPATYLSILDAVASGQTRPRRIADRIGRPGEKVSAYLDRLRQLHLLTHVQPLVGAGRVARRRGVWRLADGYLAFWFRFVRPNLTDLEAGDHERLFNARVGPELDAFVSRPAFEEACRSFVRAAVGRDPDFPSRGSVGEWRGPVPDERQPGTRRTREAEVEVVVFDGPRLVYAAEAKWRGRPARLDDLHRLRRTARHIPGFSEDTTRFGLFARAGFGAALAEVASREGVALRTADDLFDP